MNGRATFALRQAQDERQWFVSEGSNPFRLGDGVAGAQRRDDPCEVG